MPPNKNPSAVENALKRVPLHDLHVARGGKIVPFAGYEMPVQYAAGVLKEHLHTRASAGLFDVSHMGQIVLRPKSGTVENAARALERLVAAGYPRSGAWPPALCAIHQRQRRHSR